MSATPEPGQMTKKRGRPKRSQRKDVAVKIDVGVATKARFIAGIREIPLAEYLTEALRGIVDRDFIKAVRHVEGTEP